MRNVVLVTMDSLRADHCGFMGYEEATTPTLDTMADRGLSFTNAVSPGPSTPESMPVILTGSYPTEPDRTPGSLLASRKQRIRSHMLARQTLAERFARAGYATAAFTPNPYTSRYFGFDDGFETFEDFMGGTREKLYRGLLDGVLDGASKSSVLPIRLLLNWINREEVFKPWEGFYGNLVDWVDRQSAPFFLWVLLMDTHDPYLVPGDYRTQSRWAMYHANWRLWRQGHQPPFADRTHERLVRAYDDSIRYADAFLDRLSTDLDDPLIAVHGDHGEAFGEHGTYGHHAALYEENIHVPLVVGGGPCRTIRDPYSLRSLPALLISLATEGRVPDLPPRPAEARTLDEDRIALRGRNWKFLHDGEDGQLYRIPSAERERLQMDGLQEICRRLASRSRESEREGSRIARSCEEILEGDGL